MRCFDSEEALGSALKMESTSPWDTWTALPATGPEILGGERRVGGSVVGVLMAPPRGIKVPRFTAIMAVVSSTVPQVMKDKSYLPRSPTSAQETTTIRLRIMAIVHELWRC